MKLNMYQDETCRHIILIGTFPKKLSLFKHLQAERINHLRKTFRNLELKHIFGPIIDHIFVMNLTKFFYGFKSSHLRQRMNLSKRATGDRQIWAVVVIFLLIPSLVLHASAETKVASSVDLIFGPEWTFTNSQMVHADGFKPSEVWIHAIFSQVEKKVKHFPQVERLSFLTDSMAIVLKSGHVISIERDPGVLEVKVTPMTYKLWEQNADLFQSLVFDSMSEIGLDPHPVEGAGHLNIGLNYFLNKSDLAKHFLLDYFNHPGLGIVLNSALANVTDAASPVDYLDTAADNDDHVKKLQDQFIKDLRSFDLQLVTPFRSGEPHTFIGYLLEKYVAIGIRAIHISTSTSGEKTLHLNSEEARFELRQLRPQASFKDFLLAIKIFESRIKYLEKNPTVVQTDRIFKRPNGWEALGQFADYLEEAGLDFRKFKPLLLDFWRIQPVIHYERKKKTSKQNLEQNNNRTDSTSILRTSRSRNRKPVKCEPLFASE